MKTLELHLALSDDLGSDTQLFVFDEIGELTHRINSFGLKDRVYLCCIETDKNDPRGMEIFISENYVLHRDFIQNFYSNCGDISNQFKVFFQQYQTYEDAYGVALDMREENEKCYN